MCVLQRRRRQQLLLSLAYPSRRDSLAADGLKWPLPPLQSIWVRDTTTLDATGSVLSVSNTYVQMVPEPGTYALAGVGIAVAAARGLRRRLTGR